MHKKAKRTVFTILLSALCFLLLTSVGFAADKSFKYNSWDVDVVVNKDSTLNVTETYNEQITGEYTGRYRNLMYGDNVLGFSDISVSENGVPYIPGAVIKGIVNEPGYFMYTDYKYSGDYMEVLWSFRAQDEAKTFTLKYKVDGGFYYYDDTDQLEWKAVSEEREQEIDSVKVTVHLPEDISLKKADIGLNADGDSLTMKQTGKRTVVYTGKDLGANTKFWVGVIFPKGYITVNPALLAQQQLNEERQTRIRWGMISSISFSVMLVVAVFLMMLLIWYKFGREQEVPPVAEYLTEPPDDAPPAVVSEVVFEETGTKDINATLVDLARRGYLKFWDKPGDTLFQWLGDQGDLRPYEQQLIADLFAGQQTAELSSFKNVFFRKIPNLQKMMGEEACKMGFYGMAPAAVRRRYYSAGGLMLLLAGLMACCTIGFISEYFSGASETLTNIIIFSPPGAFAVAAIIVMIFGHLMPRKTLKGAEERAKWWAFRNYLANIQKYGTGGKAQEIFEKYIPYAVAFQLESVFTEAFSAQEVIPPIWFAPYWYPGYPDRGWAESKWNSEHPGESMPTGDAGVGGLGGFDLNSMSDSLTSTLNDVASTLTSQPSSSGGGGGGFSGGGGGFSGGGGGGGGSGGW
jgi:uncharacterized membrane protein